MVRRRPRPPRGPELAYVAAMRRLNAAMVAEVQRFLAGSLAEARRVDADPFVGLKWGTLKVRLGRVAGRMAPQIVDAAGNQVRSFSTEDLKRILAMDLTRETPAVRKALETFRRENVSLIRSLSTRLHDDVHQVVREAQQRGTRVETLTAQLQERYDVSKSRAELIARDQVLKANADLTRIRQEEAGVSKYVWSTSRDEKVRPLHAALEGRQFSWSDPPVTNAKGEKNHPGGDVQCRCQAIPVLD